MDLKKVRRGDIVFITQALVRRSKQPFFVKDYYEVLEKADTEGFIRVRNLFSGTIVRLRPVVMEPAKLRTILLYKKTYERIKAWPESHPNTPFMVYQDTSIQFNRISKYLKVNKYKAEDILFKIKTPHNDKVIYATSTCFDIRHFYFGHFVKIIFNKFSKDFTRNEN